MLVNMLMIHFVRRVSSCQGAGVGHRGKTRVWVQKLVSTNLNEQKKTKGKKTKQNTEHRTGHHRQQHSAGVLENKETETQDPYNTVHK